MASKPFEGLSDHRVGVLITIRGAMGYSHTSHNGAVAARRVLDALEANHMLVHPQTTPQPLRDTAPTPASKCPACAKDPLNCKCRW